MLAHFVSALKQRRAEYRGDIERVRVELEALEAREAELLAMLTSVDTLLKIEAPDIELESIRQRRRPTTTVAGGSTGDVRRVPVTKAVLRLLRTERTSMTVDEVVDRLRPTYPEMEGRKLTQNVQMFLSGKKSAGLLVANDERPLRYAVAA